MGIQVEQLTKNKTCHQKEFIDFEFNGKHVSEFGMVAVFDGGRHSFNASPGFEDETSEVNGVNGQYYWGTRYKARTKTFSLATDGMTEAQISAFKHHFQPGIYGRFIEDKFANRYAMARVSSEVIFSVVPFKTVTTVRGQKVEINEYKGEAKITFTFDDPFYYATEAVIDPNNGADALRAMYTNGTPAVDSWASSNANCWIGEGRALKKSDILPETYSHSVGDFAYYNPSTKKTDSLITITFIPKIKIVNGLYYFGEIADSINSPNNIRKCNTIINATADKEEISYFYYTSPNIIYQINHAIQIAGQYSNSVATPNIMDLEEKLRSEIVNPKVMSWAASVLYIIATKAYVDSSTGILNNNATIHVSSGPISGNLNWLKYFNSFMLCMMGTCIPNSGSFHLEKASWTITAENSYTVKFDGLNSIATIKYSYNSIGTTLEKISNVEEKCGDMVCSSYLQLEGGDILNTDGYINSYHLLLFKQNDNNTFSDYKNISLYYKYTYL